MKHVPHWFYEFLFILKLIYHNKIISCFVGLGADPKNKKMSLNNCHMICTNCIMDFM